MEDENAAKRRKIVIADDEEEEAESVDSNPDVDYDEGEINEEVQEDDGEDLMDNIYEYSRDNP